MPSGCTFSQLVRQGCLLCAAVLLVLAVQVSAHDVEESIFQRNGHRLAKRAPVSSVSFKIVTTLPQNVSQCSPLKLKFRLDKSKKKAPVLTVLFVDPAMVSSKLRTRTVKLAEISKLSPYQSFTSRDDGESIKFDLMVQEGASFEVFAFYKNGNGKWLNNTRTVGASNSSSCLPRCLKASQFRNKYNVCKSCKSVDANAARCNATVATHCAPLYLYQGRCSAYCPTGYYQNTTSFTCLPFPTCGDNQVLKQPTYDGCKNCTDLFVNATTCSWTKATSCSYGSPVNGTCQVANCTSSFVLNKQGSACVTAACLNSGPR